VECRNMSYCQNFVKNCFPHATFYRNRAIPCWVIVKNSFQHGGRLPSWIFRKKMHIWSHDCQRVLNVLFYQLATKSYGETGATEINWIDWIEFSLRYGDLTICNMAGVRHAEFSKFTVYVTWPLSPCVFASLWKMWLKSNNRLMSSGQKRFF